MSFSSILFLNIKINNIYFEIYNKNSIKKKKNFIKFKNYFLF